MVSGVGDNTQTINAPMGWTMRSDHWQLQSLNASSAIRGHTTLVEKMDDRCDGALPHVLGPVKYSTGQDSAFNMCFCSEHRPPGSVEHQLIRPSPG